MNIPNNLDIQAAVNGFRSGPPLQDFPFRVYAEDGIKGTAFPILRGWEVDIERPATGWTLVGSYSEAIKHARRWHSSGSFVYPLWESRTSEVWGVLDPISGADQDVETCPVPVGLPTFRATPTSGDSGFPDPFYSIRLNVWPETEPGFSIFVIRQFGGFVANCPSLTLTGTVTFNVMWPGTNTVEAWSTSTWV
jgi:hypothetical protein